MADQWFETVAFAQQLAKKRLPKPVYAALLAASEKGVTVADNVDAFAELGFAPHVIGALEKRDLATTVMGQNISLPVVISPTGVQAVHPDGEVAVARAAAARGTAMGLSSFASKPIEEVVAANPQLFFQVYWLGGRDAIAARVERAREAGAVGLAALDRERMHTGHARVERGAFLDVLGVLSEAEISNRVLRHRKRRKQDRDSEDGRFDCSHGPIPPALE